MSTFSTIICCINLNEHNADIAAYTKKIASDKGATIVLVHVMPSVGFLSYGSQQETLNNIMQKSENSMRTSLDSFVKEKFSGIKVEIVFINTASPANLLAVVEEHCADIIVMGSSSSKNRYSRFFSTTTNEITGTTRVPVIIIPNDLSLECVPSETF